MGKKNRKKQQDDDWEADAAALVEEDAAASAEQAVTRLDALFAEAIKRGKKSDLEYDRATDALASGEQTEDELIAFHFPNEASDAGGKKKKEKTRGWRAERDGRRATVDDCQEAADEAGGDAAAGAAAAEEEAASVQALHAELFGEAGAPYALDVAGLADGRGERERVYASELALDEWRRAASDVARELPLPNMSGACIFGEYGASTHTHIT